VAVALLASAEAYTPTAQQLIDRMRERLGTIQEVANALATTCPPEAAIPASPGDGVASASRRPS
jgi:hypothetical protein